MNGKHHIMYRKCNTAIKNIVFGNLYVDFSGDFNFTNLTNRHTGVLTIKSRGGKNENFEVSGTIKDENKSDIYKISGFWDKEIKAVSIATNEQTILWQRYPDIKDFEQQYFLPRFGVNLNYLSLHSLNKVAPTDSRLRPDQRAMEYGKIDIAVTEKDRLEVK